MVPSAHDFGYVSLAFLFDIVSRFSLEILFVALASCVADVEHSLIGIHICYDYRFINNLYGDLRVVCQFDK